jgi:hypothetical protein
MKRISIISLLIIIGVICLCLTGCFEKEDENQDARQVITEDVTEEWISKATLAEKAERIKQFASINNLNNYSSEEIKKLYNLENLEGLELSIIGKKTDDEIEEIAIINIIDQDRLDEINTKILERKIDLIDENTNNSKIIEIIDNNECNVIKQQGGIQFMIISKNAKQIEVELDKIF